MESLRLEITTTAFRLCEFTAREAGVAVIAHTDSGTADLFLDGNHHENVLSGISLPGAMVRLRSRNANYYELFDFIGPIAPEHLSEMGEQYTMLIQARFGPEQMDEMLKGSGI